MTAKLARSTLKANQLPRAAEHLEDAEKGSVEANRRVIEYREGNSPLYSKIKMPGMRKFSNITLKRGSFNGDNEFYSWFNTVQLDTIERRNITISLLNESHEPVIVWKVNNAWPLKIQSTDLKADGNEVAIESMELAHEGLEIQND